LIHEQGDTNMDFDLVAAIGAGLAGTAVMTVLMTLAPMMGMPKMDMPAVLGSMFGAPGSKLLGLVMHFMMGTIFGLVYAVLFTAITGPSIILLGVLFGVIHWLVVGLMTGLTPMFHAGIRSGKVLAPGIYMTNLGGILGFVGGLMGHIVFGLVVGLVYGLITGDFSA
jgi:hypothetical protein